MDLLTAFDSMNQSVSISVLEDYFGVSGTAIGWFKSYLVGRGFKANQ